MSATWNHVFTSSPRNFFHARFLLGDFRLPHLRQSVAVALIAMIGALTSSTVVFAQAAPAEDPGLPPESDLIGPPSELIDKKYNDPKITLQEYKEFAKSRQGYMQALRAGEATGSSKAIIEDGIRIYVLGLSLPEQREDIDNLRKKLARDLNTLAGTGEPNPRRQRTFRAYVFDQVIKHCQELLDNNLFVRLQAVALMNQLEITKAVRRDRIPPNPI